jgi:hypothetical protein
VEVIYVEMSVRGLDDSRLEIAPLGIGERYNLGPSQYYDVTH